MNGQWSIQIPKFFGGLFPERMVSSHVSVSTSRCAGGLVKPRIEISKKERIEFMIPISNLVDGKFVDSAGKTGVSAAQEPSTGTHL
jgi:hypothetical protein